MNERSNDKREAQRSEQNKTMLINVDSRGFTNVSFACYRAMKFHVGIYGICYLNSSECGQVIDIDFHCRRNNVRGDGAMPGDKWYYIFRTIIRALQRIRAGRPVPQSECPCNGAGVRRLAHLSSASRSGDSFVAARRIMVVKSERHERKNEARLEPAEVKSDRQTTATVSSFFLRVLDYGPEEEEEANSARDNEVARAFAGEHEYGEARESFGHVICNRWEADAQTASFECAKGDKASNAQ